MGLLKALGLEKEKETFWNRTMRRPGSPPPHTGVLSPSEPKFRIYGIVETNKEAYPTVVRDHNGRCNGCGKEGSER